jgi:hypothetical protein
VFGSVWVWNVLSDIQKGTHSEGVREALRGILGPKRNDGRVEKLYNEELRKLHYSPSINRMIKLRRVRSAGHAARMGEDEFILDIAGRARRKETRRKMELRVIGWGAMN